MLPKAIKRRRMAKYVCRVFDAAREHNHPAHIHPRLVEVAKRFDYGGLFAVTLCAADIIKKNHMCPNQAHRHHLLITGEDGMPVPIDEMPPPARTALRIIMAHQAGDHEMIRTLWEEAVNAGPFAALAVAGTATQIAHSPHEALRDHDHSDPGEVA